MPEAFVRLHCPDCKNRWEQNPVDLPAPDTRFQCRRCGAWRRLSEFMRTERDLEVLEEFHAE